MGKRPGTMPWESPRPRRRRKKSKRMRIEKEYPTHDDGTSKSVWAVPGDAPETNRRRH
jgi:hypothetical protein